MRSVQYTIRELIDLLLRQAEIRDGYWELGAAYEIKAGQIGDDPFGKATPLPGVIFRLAQVGLVERPEPTPGSVDATTLWPNAKETRTAIARIPPS